MQQRQRTLWTICAIAIVMVAVAVGAFYFRSAKPQALTRQPDQSVTVVAPSATDKDDVAVHVVGAVKSPGLYKLQHGARNADAVAAAGGFSKQAEQATVNLAQVAVDGSQLVVSVKGKAGVSAAGGNPNNVSASGGSSAQRGNGAVGAIAKVSLNQADAVALQQLDKIGPVLASRIVEHRTKIGGFTSVDQLLEVSGIGEKVFAGLKDHVTL